MKKLYFFLMLLCTFFITQAQLNESFDDGNFTNNPAWTGIVTQWQIIVNSTVSDGASGSNTLQLNGISGGGSPYLSIQIPGSWGTDQTWRFWLGRGVQAATASNQSVVWLYANESNLNSPTVDGYRFRFGDNGGDDELYLERITNGVATIILISTGTVLNNLTDIGFLVRIVRSPTSQWQLFTSALPTVSGSGAVATDVPDNANTPNLQGSIIDDTYTTFDNGHSGVMAVYSGGIDTRHAVEFDQIIYAFTAATVPVKLEKFDAAKIGNSVRLTWNTSQEIAVDKYEVERSLNGMDFQLIASVNAENKKWYSFVDAYPIWENNYYRLRIKDLDGKSKVSHIVSAKSTLSFSIKLFPNPTKRKLFIQHPKAEADSDIKIITTDGKFLKRIDIPENSVVSLLDISDLKKGSYILLFKIKDQLFTATVVKEE